MAVRADIDEFLKRKRILMVGVSRHDKDFTRAVYREFARRGYETVPVNPNAREVDGAPCFASAGEVEPPAGAALVMTRPDAIGRVTADCVAAGVGIVWLYRGGAAASEAAAFCRSRGVRVIQGECPMMFLSNPAWPHRAHAFCRKVVGTYPG